ncbi:MAG TPA: hypothetical protein VGR35_18585 [Tepidisphaeraceae bacterium]|nr:hypothetical protein [Tepidisphaeraceae bacterium]
MTDFTLPPTGPEPVTGSTPPTDDLPVPASCWRKRRRIVNWLAEYNPFYFLSACCMLLGIFVLNDSLTWSPLPRNNLLILIATLNVYEAALVVLAVVLLRRGLVRDGMFLLFLEAFFLADAGFLNMEIFTTDPATGLIVNGALFALAVVKVAFIFAAIGLPIRGGLFFFVIAQVALLFAIPGVFSYIAWQREGELPMLAVAGAWWAAGLVPVLYVLLVRMLPLTPIARRVGKVFIGLPFISLMAHLCLANWVYEVSFHPSNLAPLLLGLAVWVGRYDSHVSTLAWRMRMHLVLPFTAVALAAIKFPPELTFDLLGVGFSPLRLTLIAASVVYLDGWVLHRHLYFMAGSILCLLGSGLGSSVKDMNRNTLDFMEYWLESIRRLVPRTTSQWGVVSVVGAFVLLAMGAGLSLLKGAPPSRSGGVDET